MQIEDVAISAALFFDQVYPGDAEINGTLPHTNDDIAGALKDDAQLRQIGDFGLILARVGLVDAQPGFGEKFQRVGFEASFGGEGESDGGL